MSAIATVFQSALPCRGLLTALALLGVAGLSGCITTEGVKVGSATQRGPYLDAVLDLADQPRRFLFPASDVCRQVLRSEELSYETYGSFGQVFNSDDDHCTAAGVGDLSHWRKGREAGELSPSSAASWTIVHSDSDVLLLRGRFPLARRVGLPISGDAVVMVLNNELCAEIAARGAANMIYRTAGTPVLALSRCPVIAVAMPL